MFTVDVTYDSLAALTPRLVTHEGIADSLIDKLEAAESAALRGNDQAAANLLQAYANQLRAQTGKAVSAEHAELLTTLSQSL